MAKHFDVIIVGARCAGSPLATLLTRAGMKVCVVDQARFPSDTASTHGVQPSGVMVFDRLGVLERLLKVAGRVEHVTLAVDDVRVQLGGLSQLVGAPMLNARRVTLDAILLEAAAAAGADVRTQTAVIGLVEDRGRVAGVTTRTGELHAPLVVGADGARSTVARLVGASEYHQTPAGRLFLWAYFEGAQAEGGIWLGKIGDQAFLASPTDAGLFMAAVAPSMNRRAEMLRDRKAGYAEALHAWPELEAIVAEARRVGPIRVTPRWHGYFRQSAGPGWVLVGDAGHFKDPTLGQGISDALRQVVALAPAIENALGGIGGDPLHEWWSWRDRDAWEMYWFSHDQGAPGPTPLLEREIVRHIAADPQLTIEFLRVINHDVAPSKLFTPSLALAAMSKVFLTSRGQRKVLLRQARTVVVNNRQRTAAQRSLAATRQRDEYLPLTPPQPALAGRPARAPR